MLWSLRRWGLEVVLAFYLVVRHLHQCEDVLRQCVRFCSRDHQGLVASLLSMGYLALHEEFGSRFP